jgi:hypothetical protein
MQEKTHVGAKGSHHKEDGSERMKELREIFSSEMDEAKLESIMVNANSPDVVMAALISIFDGYSDVKECHWLYDFARDAIDRLFTIVAESSGGGTDDVKFMLYRSAMEYVSKHRDDIYLGYEDQFPFGEHQRDAKEELWIWPVVNEAPGLGRIEGTFQPFSALKVFGYTTGKKAGWPTTVRRQFLSDFMEKDLPPLVLDLFGDEYGAPLSTTRLRKVANVISSNCGLRLRADSERYRQAIDDWVEDLDFLKSKYYEGLGLRFVPWPDPRTRL